MVMEYIKKIRMKVGHDKVLIPSTAVVILDKGDNLLMHLRDDSNTWGLPGGLMDIGETAAESAQREVFEETGLSIKNLQLFGIFSGPEFEAKYPNGDETLSVAMGFYTNTFEGKIAKSNESLKIEFFPLNNLPENMNKFQRLFVEGFLEFRRKGSVHPVLT